jgi:hypothetical protein
MDPQAPTRTLFRPHGRIDAHREGVVIRTQAQGPFNEEAVQAYGTRLATLVAELPEGTDYVVIATMAGSILATPEAWDALESSLRGRQGGTRRQRGSAWVVTPDLEGRALFVPRARALYESLGAAFGAFEDEAAATAWALALLGAPGSR